MPPLRLAIGQLDDMYKEEGNLLMISVKGVEDAKKLFDHVAKSVKPLVDSDLAPKKCDALHKKFENHIKNAE